MRTLVANHTQEQLWRFFEEFCIWDKAAGGPDPHMKVAGYICKDDSWMGRMWMAGCYMGTYVVPSAEVIWNQWPHDRVLDCDERELFDWLDTNWAGIVLRRERRAVKSPAKLARYLRSYAHWLEQREQGQEAWMFDHGLHAAAAYDDAFDDLQEVWGLGRYIAIKGLEFMARYCGTNSNIPDIRAAGGWSPRAALATLWPLEAERLNGGDDASSVTLAETCAVRTQEELANRGVVLTMYEVQTLLCDWKQCYFGRRQYPGRSQDSEIVHADRVFAHFEGQGTLLWMARQALFGEEVLGELSGWREVRQDLAECQAGYGFTWSDFIYDYTRTGDLLCPVRR